MTIDGDSGEIAVTGVVDEARLFGNKLRLTTTISTRVGQPGMTVTDEITNISAEPGELELLYHINFGVPLVSPGGTVVLPVKKLAPRDAVAGGEHAAVERLRSRDARPGRGVLLLRPGGRRRRAKRGRCCDRPPAIRA